MAESTNSSGKAAEISEGGGGVGASREWGRGRTGGGKERSGFQRSKRVGSGRNWGGGGLKGGRQEKKGQDPEMQGTGCGRYGPPVPPTTFQTWMCYLFA